MKKRWIVALVAAIAVVALNFFITFSMLQLSVGAGQTVSFDLNEWMKLVLPLAGGAVLVIFTFLGVDRLKDFDERQDKLEERLKKEQAERLGNAIATINPQIQEKINEANRKLENDFGKKTEELTAPLNEAQQRLNIMETTLSSYVKILGSKDAALVDIRTISEAHDFVQKLYSNREADSTNKLSKMRTIDLLVERVENEELAGDNTDYHNFASELARHDHFTEAVAVVKKGLEFFNGDMDLKADYIFYSFKAGKFKDTEEEREKLAKIDRKYWNWRVFTYFIDVLNAQKATDANYQQVMELVQQYKTYLPEDERAYMAAYETYMKYGEKAQAQKELEEAEKNLAMTAQCSLTLVRIYHMNGEYEKAIKSATRAILSQAETQPSSNTGAAFARRAFAKDALIHSKLCEGEDAADYQDEIRSCIDDFEQAIGYGYGYPNLYTRIKIMKNYLKSGDGGASGSGDFEDLEKRISKLELMLKMLISKLTEDDE